jgi:hypothetical protein
MLNLLHFLFVIKPIYVWFKNKNNFFRFSIWFTALWMIFIFYKMYLFQKIGNVSFVDPLFIILPVIYSILCLVAFQIGCYYGKKKALFFETSTSYDLNKTLKLVYFYTIIGVFFQFLINNMPEEVVNKAWTGKILIYLFFSRTFTYVIPIIIILLVNVKLNRNTKIILYSILFIGLISYLQPIIFKGRRGLVIELIAIFIMPLFFFNKIKIKKIIVIPLLLFGVFMLENIGEYRELVIKEKVEPVEALKTLINSENSFVPTRENYIELENYIYLFNLSIMDNNFDYGTAYWDFFIKDYFPAQLFGRDNKQKLIINKENYNWKESNSLNYESIKGSTSTGLSDSFKSFYFFGFVTFFAVGFFMEKLYYHSLQNSFKSILLYCLIFREALHVITHGNFVLFSKLIHIYFFLIIPLKLIKNE